MCGMDSLGRNLLQFRSYVVALSTIIRSPQMDIHF